MDLFDAKTPGIEKFRQNETVERVLWVQKCIESCGVRWEEAYSSRPRGKPRGAHRVTYLHQSNNVQVGTNNKRHRPPSDYPASAGQIRIRRTNSRKRINAQSLFLRPLAGNTPGKEWDLRLSRLTWNCVHNRKTKGNLYETLQVRYYAYKFVVYKMNCMLELYLLNAFIISIK